MDVVLSWACSICAILAICGDSSDKWLAIPILIIGLVIMVASYYIQNKYFS